MKTEMTVVQAITLYTTIEALCNQFDRDNLLSPDEQPHKCPGCDKYDCKGECLK